MEQALRKVGFWVVVGIVSIVARPVFQSIALGPVGDFVPGVRKLAATP
jgi:hypothetical protein